MSHYTVGFHDNQNTHHEICEYASDAYNAIRQAREDLGGWENPHQAEYCIKED
jgi:hypothetical protein